jgi:hypothetical protein
LEQSAKKSSVANRTRDPCTAQTRSWSRVKGGGLDPFTSTSVLPDSTPGVVDVFKGSIFAEVKFMPECVRGGISEKARQKKKKQFVTKLYLCEMKVIAHSIEKLMVIMSRRAQAVLYLERILF